MLEKVKTQIGIEHFVKRVPKSGCKVYFSGIQENKLIFDLERFCEQRRFQGKRCDIAVFLEDQKRKLFCILIELKSGALDASVVSAQLKGGATVIEKILDNIDLELFPLVLTSTSHRVERGRLSREKVPFRGIHYNITLGRCNESNNLSSAIGKGLIAY